MIKLLIDFLDYLRECVPLLFSLGVYTLLSILLSRSIKKHATLYYTVFSIPFILVLIPVVCGWFGYKTFSFSSAPFLSIIVRDYIHMGTFGHPVLIIIMYIGALSPKNPLVKKLYSIRKELSIIIGFPILTHSLIRVTNTFPHALKFFTDNADYMATSNVTNELGAGISNFSFVLGIILVVLFIPLWITSFDSVHKRMGNVKWKKFQKWAYVLYALLFIHAMGIQVGGLLNPRKATAQKPTRIELVEVSRNGNKEVGSTRLRVSENKGNNIDENKNRVTDSKDNKQNRAKQKNIYFEDIKPSSAVKSYIHIVSLILIYGSYLFFRLRRANKKE